jgi:hypothetical protein
VEWARNAHPIKRTKVAWALGVNPTFLLQTKPTSGLNLRYPDHLSYDLGLSQMLYKKQKTQPFAIQVYKFKPQQKKKPRKEAKKGTAKEG